MKEGEGGKIVEIHPGWDFKRRMTELGFGKGSEVRIIKRGAPGPFIVEVKGCCRIAVGFGEASKIKVETK